jgi:hypothetical protein
MNMMITGLALVTVGAVLRYAIDSDWDALDVPIVGLILMCVGAVAFVVGLLQTFFLRDGLPRRHPQQPPAPLSPPAPVPPPPSPATQQPPVPPPPANPPHA